MIALSPHLPMTRIKITNPETVEDWYALPKDFLQFVDSIDDLRAEKEKNDFSYCWSIDSAFPFSYIMGVWNSDDNLPTTEEMLENIAEGFEELAYEEAAHAKMNWST
jgi:hypothetical protein